MQTNCHKHSTSAMQTYLKKTKKRKGKTKTTPPWYNSDGM